MVCGNLKWISGSCIRNRCHAYASRNIIRLSQKIS